MAQQNNAINNSSTLMSKLESINWYSTIHTVLNGNPTTLLVKYVVDNDSYAIMLSDFASTYFECSSGVQIDQIYNKYNRARITHDCIIKCIETLLGELPKNVQNIEKLQVDCHTTRITLRCTKLISNLNFNWNFHIISTDQDIFIKHFSLPMFRGFMYYYNLCHNQDSTDKNFINNNDNITSTRIEKTSPSSGKELFHCLNDSMLDDIFRYESNTQ